MHIFCTHFFQGWAGTFPPHRLCGKHSSFSHNDVIMDTQDRIEEANLHFAFGDDYFENPDEEEDENPSLSSLNWFTSLSMLKDVSDRRQCAKAASAISSLATARQYGDILRDLKGIICVEARVRCLQIPHHKMNSLHLFLVWS